MWFATLFNKIVAEGRTPDVWQTSVTVPVWKGKGDIADCTSYRPIRLLCHTMKVFERVLEARLRKIVSVSLNQCGFVKDCSTINAIHAARILLEKHREKNRSVHLTFLDLEEAFDRVPHELLWMSIRSHRVPEEYVRWTKLLYAKPTSVVRCAAGTSRPFPDQLQQYGLRLNTSKTEYMECGPKIEDGSIRVDGTELNKLDVSGVRPRGRLKIRWLDRVKLDMIDARLCTADAMDRTKWKTRSRKADPATTRDKR
ncbi:hypothetical protein NECAME_07150 [Necator americanus]|uniref:Reverse transcriptase domain-containing protein n=1 Tax=Necator americanus TaxID=51031 RepID=W2TQ07_NECAM|nr:hypothetical protein NECAME_07150 [Necator americanus]ETN83858.1 hypothetical protein NECAME_07150 [Necator americanus]